LCLPGPDGDPITLFYDGCLGPGATSDKCNTVRTAHAACVSCILTPVSAAKYGPLVDHTTFVTANIAGCLELLVPGELACARAVQSLDGCELTACQANCPVFDSASFADYQSCVTSVETGACMSYATVAACALEAPDAVARAIECLADFASFYAAVAPIFCGPSGQDAGPSPLDASRD
jgi:hypothetical protein